MKMTIRASTSHDIPSIMAIYNEAIEKTTATFDTEPKTLVDRTEWWTKHGSNLPILVCEEDGKILGWGSLSLWSERLAYAGTVENSVYVWEKYRGRGVGKALMSELIILAKQRGFHTVIARIADGNETSIRLHQQFGFESIGIMREVGRKFGRLLDVHMMQLMIQK